ncbi:MAG: sensor domain-containing protein, partial [Actinomycetota bacterium]|nr:sensor domain-containing protein [Actinomycetota bacterium]
AVGATGALILLPGCTRHIEEATPRAGSVAAPIVAAQVVDLLSPNVLGAEGNLFADAQPERCAGLAREVDPPFIEAQSPVATDGGHWTTPDAAVYIEEMVAVYRYDFDPSAALDLARQTLDDCRDVSVTVTTMQDRTYVFDAFPAPAQQPDGSVIWQLRAVDWNCDNTFVAAYNAAIEITACGAAGGFDIAELAEGALARIEALANTTA